MTHRRAAAAPAGGIGPVAAPVAAPGGAGDVTARPGGGDGGGGRGRPGRVGEAGGRERAARGGRGGGGGAGGEGGQLRGPARRCFPRGAGGPGGQRLAPITQPDSHCSPLLSLPNDVVLLSLSLRLLLEGRRPPVLHQPVWLDKYLLISARAEMSALGLERCNTSLSLSLSLSLSHSSAIASLP